MKTNNMNIDFIAKKKLFFTISSILIVAILTFSFIFGVKMDIQFTGGAMLKYEYVGDIDDAEIKDIVDNIIETNSTVQLGDAVSTNKRSLTISLAGTKTISAAELSALMNAFDEQFAANELEQLEVVNVNPTIGKEFFLKSLVAVGAASLLILVYIAFRFKNIGGWSAGSMAIIALIHDLIVVFGVYSILRIPLNGNFIAAVLTILGYSINDTVVIYDRIRENRVLHGKKMPFSELVNLSINQSLVRSINTTFTTVMALGVVCVVALINNMDSIFTFVFPLIIGMVSGVYSSICLAGPLWATWEERKISHKKGSKKAK